MVTNLTPPSASTVLGYYRASFAHDLRGFFATAKKRPFTQSVGGVLEENGPGFSVMSLYPRPFDCLVHVRRTELPFFAASLAYVVLVNEVIHHHFPGRHREFNENHQFPVPHEDRREHNRLLGAPPIDGARWEDGPWAARGDDFSDVRYAWASIVSEIRSDVEPDLPQGLSWDDFSGRMGTDRDVCDRSVPWGEAVRLALRCGRGFAEGVDEGDKPGSVALRLLAEGKPYQCRECSEDLDVDVDGRCSEHCCD